MRGDDDEGEAGRERHREAPQERGGTAMDAVLPRIVDEPGAQGQETAQRGEDEGQKKSGDQGRAVCQGEFHRASTAINATLKA